MQETVSVKDLFDDKKSSTHPSKSDRIDEIVSGWKDGNSILNKEAEKKCEFMIMPHPKEIYYHIKKMNGEVLRRGQGYKSFKLPIGNYEVIFYNKQDTGTIEFFLTPETKFVLPKF